MPVCRRVWSDRQTWELFCGRQVLITRKVRTQGFFEVGWKKGVPRLLRKRSMAKTWVMGGQHRYRLGYLSPLRLRERWCRCRHGCDPPAPGRRQDRTDHLWLSTTQCRQEHACWSSLNLKNAYDRPLWLQESHLSRGKNELRGKTEYDEEKA